MQSQIGSAIATAVLCVLLAATAGAQAPASTGVSASETSAQATSAYGSTGASVPRFAPDARRVGADSIASHASAQDIGPTTRGAAVGVRAIVTTESSREDLVSVQQAPNVGRSKALMIVGGAALVAGLLIGDDAGAVLAVGGAVVGLYGLYQFVR